MYNSALFLIDHVISSSVAANKAIGGQTRHYEMNVIRSVQIIAQIVNLLINGNKTFYIKVATLRLP